MQNTMQTERISKFYKSNRFSLLLLDTIDNVPMSDCEGSLLKLGCRRHCFSQIIKKNNKGKGIEAT